MYAFIEGKIEYVKDNLIVINNNGIGYNVRVTVNALEKLNKEKARVYTYLNVTQDGMALYGFYSLDEKAMFEKLITVTGVGPKMAIQILSGMDLNNLLLAIANKDVKMLSQTKGVGKKTAERIILELKGSISFDESGEDITINGAVDNNLSDAIDVLVGLGINKAEAYKAVKIASQTTKETNALITLALRSLDR
ncbi:MAG: Holliday junction branch migration protein RuvA [Clostridia bacterium]